MRILSLALGLLTAWLPALAQQTRPNIVFILADDLGYGDIGPFGQKVIQTPHLDRMATEGLKLTNFYSGSTVCAPSRCAFLTGKHTGHAYVRGNGEVPLRPGDQTIAARLKAAGYATGLFGKWGLGDIGTTGSPDQQGWGTFAGYLHHVEGHFQMPGMLWEFSPENPTLRRGRGENQGGYLNDVFANRAVEFIGHQQGKPFFVYLALTLPHAQLLAPADAMKPYLTADGQSRLGPETPYVGGHYGGQPMPRAAYAAMVSRVDRYVGQVLNALKAKGLDKNTLVLFSSDNGTHLEGGRDRDDVAYFNSSGGLKGVKRDLTEGGIRVPTVAWWPGTLPAGQTRNGAGAFWDLLPTFGELAGVPKPADADGISLINHWKTGAALPERPLYWEFYEGGYHRALRVGDDKLIHKQPRTGGTATVELYDLKTDPGEEKNLATQQAAKVQELEKLLNAQHRPAEHALFRAPGEN
jgi:arylsulfatase A-like enzyme